MKRVRVVAVVAIALVALSTAALAIASATPVLGSATKFQNGEGFGKVKPKTVFLGGDPTGMFKKVTWKHWGSATATGTGTGFYPPPGKPVAESVKVPAKLVASSLGTCHGHEAYRKIRFYFTYKGHTKPGAKYNIC
jgi:hypothetical protein